MLSVNNIISSRKIYSELLFRMSKINGALFAQVYMTMLFCTRHEFCSHPLVWDFCLREQSRPGIQRLHICHFPFMRTSPMQSATFEDQHLDVSAILPTHAFFQMFRVQERAAIDYTIPIHQARSLPLHLSIAYLNNTQNPAISCIVQLPGLPSFEVCTATHHGSSCHIGKECLQFCIFSSLASRVRNSVADRNYVADKRNFHCLAIASHSGCRYSDSSFS